MNYLVCNLVFSRVKPSVCYALNCINIFYKTNKKEQKKVCEKVTTFFQTLPQIGRILFWKSKDKGSVTYISL